MEPAFLACKNFEFVCNYSYLLISTSLCSVSTTQAALACFPVSKCLLFAIGDFTKVNDLSFPAESSQKDCSTLALSSWKCIIHWRSVGLANLLLCTAVNL